MIYEVILPTNESHISILFSV